MNATTGKPEFQEPNTGENKTSLTVIICADDNSVLMTRTNCTAAPSEGDTVYHTRKIGDVIHEYTSIVVSRTFAYSQRPGIDPDIVYCYTDFMNR